MRYKFIQGLTSDVMYEAYGKDLKELFENAAMALLSVICKVEEVIPKQKEGFEVKGNSLEELMINWLQSIIAIVDTEEKFYSKVEVKVVDENHVLAELSGEPIIPEKGDTVVKAVTYYKFKLEQDKKGYKVTVSLDI